MCPWYVFHSLYLFLLIYSNFILDSTTTMTKQKPTARWPTCGPCGPCTNTTTSSLHDNNEKGQDNGEKSTNMTRADADDAIRIVWAIGIFFRSLLFYYILTKCFITVFNDNDDKKARQRKWWATTMRASPDNAICIVWAVVKFFLFSFITFLSLTKCFISDVVDSDYMSCVVWALGEILFFFFVFFRY